MRYWDSRLLGSVIVAVAVFALSPIASPECSPNAGGVCSGNNDYSIVPQSCDGCGGSININIIVPFNPSEGYGSYWFAYQCQTVCCGGQGDMLTPPEGDGSCGIATLRDSRYPPEELAREGANSVYLVRQCDGTYAAVDFGAGS